MSILNGDEILELIERGVILNAKPENVNSASLDVTLGPRVLFEATPFPNEVWEVRLRDRKPLRMVKGSTRNGFVLFPGTFVLAETVEVFNLPPDISAEYALNSSMARMGLEHLHAGWCDAGWHGSVLTLELKNVTQHHRIRIQEGDTIGQVIFHRHRPVSDEFNYARKGAYNGDRYVSGAKPKKRS